MIALVLAAALNCGATATQADLDECASASNKAAMAREARAYKALVQRHPNDSVLSASETQWQRERRATCDFYAAMVAGGSMTPMVVDNCWADSADDRVRVLALY
ncbi:MAG TPA: lysozyme inhibitor LprI family protein, partial [Candidatus Aquilonibacter sp.]